MKKTLNIFSNEKIKNFLVTIFSKYETIFMKLVEIDYDVQSSKANVVILNNNKDINLINFKNLNSNYLIISSLKNNDIKQIKNLNILRAPLLVNHLKNKVDNFIQNLKVQFHDITIHNERLINLKNNSFCYLTKSEIDILTCLLIERETTKNFIKENILNIKSNIDTNSLESHLTRIRKKMNNINTIVKIHTKSEKLKITI